MNGPLIEDFAPHTGKLSRPEGGAFGLALARIEPAPPGFILLFSGVAGDVLAAGLYNFTLEDGAFFSFHLTPVHTSVPDRQNYQAVFN